MENQMLASMFGWATEQQVASCVFFVAMMAENFYGENRNRNWFCTYFFFLFSNILNRGWSMVERRDNSRPRCATIKIAEQCAQLCRRKIFSLSVEIQFSLFTNIIQLVRQFAPAREEVNKRWSSFQSNWRWFHRCRIAQSSKWRVSSCFVCWWHLNVKRNWMEIPLVDALAWMAFHNWMVKTRWMNRKREKESRALWEVGNYPVIMHSQSRVTCRLRGRLRSEIDFVEKPLSIMKSLLQSFVIARSCERRSAERVELIFAWNHRPKWLNMKLMLVVFLDVFCFTLSRRNLSLKYCHKKFTTNVTSAFFIFFLTLFAKI